jgi:hypothetical protein
MDFALFQRRVGHWAVVGLFAAAALLSISFLPTAYATSWFPPSRTLIVPQFILVLAVFAVGYGGAALAAVTRPRTLALRFFEVLVCTLLIAAPLWSVYQTFQLHADAAWYAKLWDRRDRRLRAAASAGQAEVILDPLPLDLAIPGSIAGFPNPMLDEYYGFRKVTNRPIRLAENSWVHEAWFFVIAPEMIPDFVRGIGHAIRRRFRRS